MLSGDLRRVVSALVLFTAGLRLYPRVYPTYNPLNPQIMVDESMQAKSASNSDRSLVVCLARSCLVNVSRERLSRYTSHYYLCLCLFGTAVPKPLKLGLLTWSFPLFLALKLPGPNKAAQYVQLPLDDSPITCLVRPAARHKLSGGSIARFQPHLPRSETEMIESLAPKFCWALHEALRCCGLVLQRILV